MVLECYKVTWRLGASRYYAAGHGTTAEERCMAIQTTRVQSGAPGYADDNRWTDLDPTRTKIASSTVALATSSSDSFALSLRARLALRSQAPQHPVLLRENVRDIYRQESLQTFKSPLCEVAAGRLLDMCWACLSAVVPLRVWCTLASLSRILRYSIFLRIVDFFGIMLLMTKYLFSVYG